MSPEQFWSKVTKTQDGCWLWHGWRDSKGYGRVGNTGAHRIAWLLTNGSVPAKCICHHCDTPLCVNPNHLFVGSHQDNSQDAAMKGRLRSSFLGNHCLRGHNLKRGGIETFQRKDGTVERVCRLCRIARRLRYIRKKALNAQSK